jgi:hypothetical protein
MTLTDPNGTSYTRVGNRMVPNALPATAGLCDDLSRYDDLGETAWRLLSQGQDDYGLAGLALGPEFRKSLNQTLNLAFSVIEFEAVHNQLPFGCPIAEIRRCCDQLEQWAAEFNAPNEYPKDTFDDD